MSDETLPPAPGQDDLFALPSGYVINEYRIERVLGGGGFGITYLAHDTHLDCQVAIKEYLPKDLAVRREGLAVRSRSSEAAKGFEWGLQRFLLESRALASFHHPGIVRVLRYFRGNDTAYMVMEYETGQPLQRWLVGRLPLDRASLVRIVRRCSTGWRRSTRRVFCTVTSSPATSTSAPTVRRCCSTSGRPAGWSWTASTRPSPRW